MWCPRRPWLFVATPLPLRWHHINRDVGAAFVDVSMPQNHAGNDSRNVCESHLSLPLISDARIIQTPLHKRESQQSLDDAKRPRLRALRIWPSAMAINRTDPNVCQFWRATVHHRPHDGKSTTSPVGCGTLANPASHLVDCDRDALAPTVDLHAVASRRRSATQPASAA